MYSEHDIVKEVGNACRDLSVVDCDISEFESILTDLRQSTGLADRISKACVGLANDPSGRSPNMFGSSFVLLNNLKYRVILQKLRSSTHEKFMVSSDTSYLTMPLSDTSNILITRYSANWEHISVFDPSVKLTYIEEDIVCGKEKAFFISAGDVVDIEILNDDPGYALVAMEKLTGQYVWHFDRETLQATMIASALPEAGRVQTAIEVLSLLGGSHVSSDVVIAALKDACHHEAHFVRWAAVRHLTQASLSEGYEKLQELTMDSHPHVAVAAGNALPLVLTRLNEI